jgi:anti-sigma regulatory factor (Ser/Thr protein kinase)
LPTIVLLTSELVTNAVVHPRAVGDTPICLRVTVYEDRVRVEVEDQGEGFRRIPSGRPEGERGRGLFLVEQFSNQWGSGRVQTDAGQRFRVWFEIQLGSQKAAAATG